MECEICRECEATVHLTEIVNNTKKVIHLCEACAQEKGVAVHSHVKNLSIPEFFQHTTAAAPSSDSSNPTCDECGIDYATFRSSGKLGCPNDYRVFRGELEQLLEKIHGSTQHRGKVPSRIHMELSRRKELDELRVELRSAVDNEEYEHAAELRDRISTLERDLSCS